MHYLIHLVKKQINFINVVNKFLKSKILYHQLRKYLKQSVQQMLPVNVLLQF